ncbi:MAG: SRPBCC family protein [Gemmatimonadaceae bacterium]|nr:SRPBCC family protein [Gemmatimonadaceae bacterium]
MTSESSGQANPAEDRYELTISRLLAVPRALLWKAWTDPDHLKEWWCPKPWTTDVRKFDLRPGGDFHTFMSGPDGGTSDNPGCFLEIVPELRLVFTSMLVGGYRPADAPWMPMTAVITMADEAGGTRYTANVMHASREGRDSHETMGFFDGWNTCITQLEEHARTLR